MATNPIATQASMHVATPSFWDFPQPAITLVERQFVGSYSCISYLTTVSLEYTMRGVWISGVAMSLRMSSILTRVRIASHRQNSRKLPRLRTCEKMNYLALRRRGAEIRKKQLLCFLFALCAFAPRREMLLIVGGFFRGFSGSGQARQGRAWAEDMKKKIFGSSKPESY